MPKRVNTTAPLDYADQDLEKIACSIRAILGADGFGRFADHVPLPGGRRPADTRAGADGGRKPGLVPASFCPPASRFRLFWVRCVDFGSARGFWGKASGALTNSSQRRYVQALNRRLISRTARRLGVACTGPSLSFKSVQIIAQVHTCGHSRHGLAESHLAAQSGSGLPRTPGPVDSKASQKPETRRKPSPLGSLLRF